ncbi:hypothetical protein CEK26_007172 [Fusarium fujikuroi]|nr:hypothetical protein CEK27_007191 [Fusarium fujikuroi]QGI80386.1 hypothetical protein CEK25_007115 [Fusarium fujikuroi]QGI80499.1 hypothetical protein CEK25_007228 [Fusarium fujikuroi]QGI94103.1 hypothetical protein CEK26_007172 [Fusarium fujikuroi]
MPSWTSNNDDKMSSWRDQLSPRNLSFRGFRRASDKDFTMLHYPDRRARRITEADIPSDEECKKSLINMRKASFVEQIHRRHEFQHQKQLSPVREPAQEELSALRPPQHDLSRIIQPQPQPPTEQPRTVQPQTAQPRIIQAPEEQPRLEHPRAQQPSRLTFGPFNGQFRSAFGPLTPAEEEPCPLEKIDTIESTATATPQVPQPSVDIRKSLLVVDDLNIAREPSPSAVISEAKTIKLERVDNHVTPGVSPISSPRPSDASASGRPRRKQSVQMVAIRRSSQDSQKRKQSVHTVVVRRPSKPTADALNSHPVHASSTQVHVRQDSASDPMCRVCHNGIAETSGTCSSCENDSITATPVEISPNFSRLHHKPTAKKYNRPPPLIPQSLDGIAKLHRPSASLTSDPEANSLSPPASPTSHCSSPAETVKTVATGPSVPPTPKSALSTPEVFKRFQEEVESRAKADDSPSFDDPWMIKSKTPEDDVYEDDWADYYFDEQNFNDDKVTNGPVPGANFVPSPVNPGPGWI